MALAVAVVVLVGTMLARALPRVKNHSVGGESDLAIAGGGLLVLVDLAVLLLGLFAA